MLFLLFAWLLSVVAGSKETAYRKEYSGLSFDPSRFVCHYFEPWCYHVLEGIGCHHQNMTVVGCSPDLPNFVGNCTCSSPVFFTTPSTRIQQELVVNRIAEDMSWMLEPWDTGPPYDLVVSYKSICKTVLERLDCPGANKTIIAENEPVIVGGVKSQNFKCSCGNFDAASSMIMNLAIDKVNEYELRSTPVFSNPVYLSVPVSLAMVLICGKLGAIIAMYIKLPAIIGYLFAGLGIQNIIHPMVLKGPGFPFPSVSSELKLIALIIIIMRAGLSIKYKEMHASGLLTSLLCIIPYFCEFILWLFVGAAVFDWDLKSAGLLSSIMAPQGPSIVISTILSLLSNVEKQYGCVPQLVSNNY